MGLYWFSYFAKLAILARIIQIAISTCNLTTHSFNKAYTIHSWNGNWTFENFVTGPRSGDTYYLVSSSDLNQCGIIREDSSGNEVWAKIYTNGQ